MSDLSLRLDLYPDLSPEERAAVDLEVADRPDLEGAHADARRLAAIVDAAQSNADLEAAERAFDRRVSHGRTRRIRSYPPPLGGDPLEARIDALAREARDPIAHFESLSGRAVSYAAPEGDGAAPQLRLVDLEVAAPRPRSRWKAHLIAAAAILAISYGAAAGVSTWSVSERAQVADLDHVEAIGMPTVRGEGPTSNETSAVEALQSVLDARRSTLGLFPRYDAVALEAAAADLEAVAADVEPGSWVSQEVRLVRGRVLVHLNRDAEAARVLGDLVREGDYRAPAARRLLDYVRSPERDG